MCKVEEIGNPVIGGKIADRLYYTLSPLYRSGRVLAPVEGKVFMRPVISREDAMALIEAIPATEEEACEERNLRMLTEHYQARLQQYDPMELVRVIKSVQKKRDLALSRGKKLGQIDERFMHRAEEMLYGELAVALKIEKNQVVSFIAETIG
ncbi:MAG: hypothetical protein IJ788_08210 [Oscillospiraceae bacterium]|nr:hypothetical protein [Oscillospiraceae bacterium]